MHVTVYGPLRSATGGKSVELDFGGGSVEAMLASFVETYPRAESQLYADDGTLRSSVRVTVDGKRADPADDCPAAADVTILPAVQGGGDRPF